jgi:hypothetical protein
MQVLRLARALPSARRAQPRRRHSFTHDGLEGIMSLAVLEMPVALLCVQQLADSG